MRVIEGWATTPAESWACGPWACGNGLHRILIDPRGARFRLPLPVLLEHEAVQVGWVHRATVAERGIWVRARLFDKGFMPHVAWKLIQRRQLNSFSVGIGSGSTCQEIGGAEHYTDWRWTELSLVRFPGNPQARFHVLPEVA